MILGPVWGEIVQAQTEISAKDWPSCKTDQEQRKVAPQGCSDIKVLKNIILGVFVVFHTSISGSKSFTLLKKVNKCRQQ